MGWLYFPVDWIEHKAHADYDLWFVEAGTRKFRLLGYPDPFTFSKAFKKYYNVPPSKFE
ncbi:hypothetical protein [Paenibacillus harenae]|uniref:HTH araC/xylS-type domain-containing protein n=1 Tax=Paenibacillus harenae TaxID=306543 RepID=A0ABT9TXY5_PAEHA|nr:hypothetical protein [Paenibacillus harenae]MDQ0112230.1 hypothetical protein [Paenibacillus harenae]